eukprot:scaffold87867_cov59-Phaeocystis_antarctica.AAC.8
MVASCHRRSGDYQLAFEIYRMIHADFPDNVACLRSNPTPTPPPSPSPLTAHRSPLTFHPHQVECLRYLVHICDDLGKKDQVHEYVVKLRKAERAQEPQQGHGGGGGQEGPDTMMRGGAGPSVPAGSGATQYHAQQSGGQGGGHFDDENAPHNREQQQQSYTPGESAYENSQVHAAAAGGKAGPSKVVSAAGVDEDHFADGAGLHPRRGSAAGVCERARGVWFHSTGRRPAAPSKACGRGGVAVAACYRVVRSVVLQARHLIQYAIRYWGARGARPPRRDPGRDACGEISGAVAGDRPGVTPHTREMRCQLGHGVRVCGCGHEALFVLYNKMNEG